MQSRAEANPTGIDAYAPAEMALRVERAGVAKAGLPLLQTLTLAVLAGAFIALGALLYAVVMTGNGFGFGPARLLGGFAFSLGLVLVLVGGAELFTGNSLIVMAWAGRLVTTAALLRNWGLVLAGNVVGGVGTAILVTAAATTSMADGAVGATVLDIAKAKAGLPPVAAFARGVLCNVLVCLAVWLSFAAREVVGKVVVISFPIAAFVALGFEHNIANVFFFALAELHAPDAIAWPRMADNLLWVTLGNMAGGGGLVALVYWLVYLRGRAAAG